MYKNICAVVLGCSFIVSNAQVLPIPKLVEPSRPSITYVEDKDVQIMPTPGEPNAIRILCSTLKGKGDVAITIGGTTLIFPVNCPSKPIAPFE